MAQHAGGCLCGAVQYVLEGVFEKFFLCHCNRCRKGSGSAYAANLFAPKATLDWRAGSNHVVRFQVPGTQHVRAFCSICGGTLPRVEGGGAVVPAGSLDSKPTIMPQAHIFVGDCAGWDEFLKALPRFASLPDSTVS